MSDHPADDVPTEDVHDHVEVKVGPLDRAFQFGDIPGPNFIGFYGKQFGFLVAGALMSPSSFFDTAVLQGEDPVHGPDGTMILPFIQKGGVDLIGGLILKSI
jgi:hypothetical protein